MDKEKSFTKLFAEQRFNKRELWLMENLCFECIMGSHAYGFQTQKSDFDIVALVMDKPEKFYPYQYGFILGFDQLPNFENKELKGKNNRIILENGKDCEGEWNSIIRFFYLAGVKGSPNLIETLFAHKSLIKYGNDIAWMLRDNRRLFLSMRSFHAIKGYCYSQFDRMRREIETGTAETAERREFIIKYGMDLKKATHVIRLLDLCHQILSEDDIDLMRAKNECKSMRSGNWGTFQQLETYVNEKLQQLDRLTENGYLANKPRLPELHILLANCIEQWYGSELEFQKQNTEYVSVKMMMEHLDKMDKKLDLIYKK
jgi:hypothetical protein